MRKSKTKKAKVDEIEKIVGDTATVHAFGWSEDLSKQLRRRLRALVREVWNIRTRKTAYWAAIEFKERFGIEP